MELGPSFTLVRLLSNVEKNGNQMLNLVLRDGQPNSQLNFKVLIILWENHTRVFSILRKALGMVLKDSDH